MKTLLLLLPLALCGCTGLSKTIRELAKDPNTVAISITTVYGTAHMIRTGHTNQQITAGPISVK
jgi:hypothetical protein